MSGKKTGLQRLRCLIMKVKKSMSLVQPISPADDDDASSSSPLLPGYYVKQGYFTVLATNGCQEESRFVMKLKYLKDPEFLKLLELAKDEYGSCRLEGALVIPCPPQDLEKILQGRI